ncbi:serine hydrolase [Chelatococcus sp. GCM10030263]|uniref:D-alanyl-D-alanine carboxypeptidase family protein n=1 Tax=Chelatococcus sp. GCM10030263 TaxID=3273387 RepID=UPI00361C1DF2
MTNAISRLSVAFLFLVTAAVSQAFITPAKANPTLVVDIASGRVLHSSQATEPWYPASLTKLLTTYIVLQEIRAGRLTLETPLTVSARAEAEAPSKMGFKPGTVVTVDNALKMMLVKSANDLAVVFAEGVSGSVDAFVERMNQTAQQLGMRDSHFANPNGMPDERQHSSARDLAVLARALLTEFAPYRGYFGIGAVQLGKRLMRNTNGLIGRYPGATGMKTGFICSSGFNVVATAVHGHRELLVVVLGAPTAVQRTIQAAELLDTGFSQRGWGSQTLDSLPVSTATAPPDLRDEICGANRGKYLADDDNAAPVSASVAGSEGISLFAGPRVNGVAAVRGSAPNRLAPRAKTTPIAVFVGATPGDGPDSTAVATAGKGKDAQTSKQAATAKPIAVRKTAKGGRPPREASAFAPVEEDAKIGNAPMALQRAIKPAKGGSTKKASGKAKSAKSGSEKATKSELATAAKPPRRPTAKSQKKPTKASTQPLSLAPPTPPRR